MMFLLVRHRHRRRRHLNNIVFLLLLLLLVSSCYCITLTSGEGIGADEDQVFKSEVVAATYAAVTGNLGVLLSSPALLPNHPTIEAVRAAVLQVLQLIRKLIHYQPPTGFVILVVVLRVVLSGRIFHLYDNKNDEETFLFQQQSNSRRPGMSSSGGHPGRAFVLLEDDKSYSQWGGMQPVRRRLCWSALRDLEFTSAKNGGGNYTKSDNNDILLQSVTSALEVTSTNQDQMASSMVKPMASLEHVEQQQLQRQHHPTSSSRYTKFKRAVVNRLVDDDIPIRKLLALASVTSQVRAVDAMLRVCRDRFLKTVYRLAMTVEHWDRRVQKHSSSSRWSRKPNKVVEMYRDRLVDASASYEAEVKRLGETLLVLLDRPPDAKKDVLIQALRDSGRSEKSSAAAGAEKNERESRPRIVVRSLKQVRKGLMSKISKVPKYSLRWKSHSSGNGFLSIRKFSSGDAYIDGSSAVAALFADDDSTTTSDYKHQQHDDNYAWTREASSWEHRVRDVLCRVVGESLQGSISSRSTSRSSNDYTNEDFAKIEKSWCHPQQDVSGRRSSIVPGGANETNEIGMSTANDASTEEEDTWRGILRYVDGLPSWRRAGEGQRISIKDVFFSLQWIKRLDLFGIPSSLLIVYGASLIHEYFIKPYWSHIRRDTVVFLQKTLEIAVTRFWLPMKGIWDDMMNKNAGIFEGFGFGLEDEQVFLDHMLRDLGFGDGTPSAREEALRLATEEYERDFYSGLFTNFLTGRLARLMLVQVQQLKVGLLLAVDTTDTLMQGNRIHFQLLAAIPAVLIATYGTRFFLRGLYNIRAKDIRPVRLVHREMATYLDKVESLILLIGHDYDSQPTDGTDSLSDNSRSASSRTPSPSQLGEVCLNIHRYLILMDYASPPLPASRCDDIHDDLRAILTLAGQQGLPTPQLAQWVWRVKQKHQDLLKFL